MAVFDQQDQGILAERQEMILERTAPGQGDFIRFPNGELRRIAHVWCDENDNPRSIQPTLWGLGGGGFYLGKGFMSFSGGLSPGISVDAFSPTDELMPGTVWFFHHDWQFAFNGVMAKCNCRVWKCAVPPII